MEGDSAAYQSAPSVCSFEVMSLRMVPSAAAIGAVAWLIRSREFFEVCKSVVRLTLIQIVLSFKGNPVHILLVIVTE